MRSTLVRCYAFSTNFNSRFSSFAAAYHHIRNSGRRRRPKKRRKKNPTHFKRWCWAKDVFENTNASRTFLVWLSIPIRCVFVSFVLMRTQCHSHSMSCYASLTVNCNILNSTLWLADDIDMTESKFVLRHYRKLSGNISHRTNRKINSIVRGWLAKFSNNLENLFIWMWHWIPFWVGVGDRYFSFLIFYERASENAMRRQ